MIGLPALLLVTTVQNAPAVAGPTLVTPPVAVGTTDAAALAVKLAELLDSPDLITAQSARYFDKTVQEALSANSSIQALERAHPGFTAGLIVELRDETERQVVSKLSDLRAAHAQILAARFTQAEIEQLVRFHQSSAYAGYRRLIAANADYANLLVQGPGPDETVQSGSEIDRARKNAASQVYAGLAADQQREISRFWASKLGRKFQAVKPELSAASLPLLRRDKAADDAALNAVLTAYVSRFLTQNPRQTPLKPSGSSRADN